MPLIIDDAVVDETLRPAAAAACMRTVFDLLASGAAVDHPRERFAMGGTTLNVMSAIAPTLDAVALKSYPVVRTGGSRASVITVVIYGHSTGALRAVLRGDLLGQRRTAAASAIVASAMARPESETICLLGTGYQASAQVTAMVEVLPKLATVLVVGRTAQRAEAIAAALRAAHPRLRVEAGSSAVSAVPRADVVITATSAAEPLFDGGLLRLGTHVNAVGSNNALRRELDCNVFRRGARVVVDSRAVAMKECGDLLANGLDPAAATEFAEVQAGRVPGRAHQDDITVFESHGFALQDLVCAVHVIEAARNAGLGIALDSGSWAPGSGSTHLDPRRSQ